MAAASGDGGKRKPFGNRFLTDPARLFQHNAWDNVEWSEEQEAAAQAKVRENSTEFVSKAQQDAYEMDAHTYWNDFYKTHENGFFKDRHWLFTEFPELAPNQRHSQVGTGASEDTVGNAKNSGFGCCKESGVSSVEPEVSKQLDCEKNSSSAFYHSHTENEMGTQKQEEEELRETDFPGSSAMYRILEVGCGAGNTVFPILQTNK